MNKEQLEKYLFEKTGEARHDGKKSLWLSSSRFDLIESTITSLTVNKGENSPYFMWWGIKVIRQPESNVLTQ